MVAAVETVPDFRVLSREVLLEGPYTRGEFFSNYDIHPDGERFVMIRPAGRPQVIGRAGGWLGVAVSN